MSDIFHEEAPQPKLGGMTRQRRQRGQNGLGEIMAKPSDAQGPPTAKAIVEAEVVLPPAEPAAQPEAGPASPTGVTAERAGLPGPPVSGQTVASGEDNGQVLLAAPVELARGLPHPDTLPAVPVAVPQPPTSDVSQPAAATIGAQLSAPPRAPRTPQPGKRQPAKRRPPKPSAQYGMATESGPTRQVNVYILPTALREARRMKDDGLPYAQLALNALDWALDQGILYGLIEDRLAIRRPVGSRFPPRVTRRTQPNQEEGSRVLWPVPLTEAEIAVVDDFRIEVGAKHRSTVIAAAVEAYLRPDDDLPHSQDEE
ncbi:hypothetical protein ACIBH1_48670 [Nonomuraea sp. NPDC050663]|uniref:hypothetical protein n=1 Tax=Nonomuraea sp. NPDC050663 TaxID=3364370 RepID=UPI0037B1ADA0